MCHLYTHTQYAVSHSHLSSNLVSLHRCHQPWWCQRGWNLHGWSPYWLIASLSCTLHSQTENCLSFMQWLVPLFPSRVSHSLVTLWLCARVIVHVWLWARGECGRLQPRVQQCAGMKKSSFCGWPVSQRINSSLLHVSRQSGAVAEREKGKSHFASLDAKRKLSLRQIQDPQTVPLKSQYLILAQAHIHQKSLSTCHIICVALCLMTRESQGWCALESNEKWSGLL